VACIYHDDENNVLKFTCFLQTHLVYMSLGKSQLRAVTDRYFDLKTFVVDCLDSFSSNSLMNGSRDAKDNVPEDMFQKEFYRVSTMLTPKEVFICPELNNMFEKRPDFYINSSKRWVVELLIENGQNGEKLNLHVHDVVKDIIHLNNFMVIDFERESQVQNSKNQLRRNNQGYYLNLATFGVSNYAENIFCVVYEDNFKGYYLVSSTGCEYRRFSA